MGIVKAASNLNVVGAASSRDLYRPSVIYDNPNT